jgi:hypothetical protein
MQSLPEGHIKKTGKAGERLNHIVGFTSELGDIISEGSLTGSSEQNKLKIKDLLNRYSSTIIFTEDEIDTLLKNVLEEIDNYTSMFNISTTNVSIIDKLTISTGGTVKPRQHIQKTPSKKILSPKAEARRLARKKQAEHEMILLNGVEDVAQAVIRHDSVETVIMMMLETMYRGLNLSHVLACMKTGDDGLMTASSGFGEDIEEYTRRFRFYVDRRKKDQNLFTMSLLQSRDFVVNTEKERSKTLMFPEWYQGLEKPKWIFIYPLLIDGHPEGLFYGDIMQEDATIDRDLLKHIHPLRAHVAKAIRRSNQSRH